MKRGDLIAGLCIAGLMLPEAVAYAGIAGLPPQRAIFAGIAGCLFYAMVGRSRFAIVSPTSSSAAILAATLAASSIHPADRATVATIVILLAGVLFTIAAAARLGALTSFISRPVLRGFAFGIAVTIILHQLPVVAGVSIQASNIASLCIGLLTAIPQWNVASLLTGLVALIALLAFRRLPLWPGALIVLGAGIFASGIFDLSARHVAMVGAIDMTMAWPSLPHIGLGSYLQFTEFALPLVLILFAESWSTIRTLALRHGDTVEANRELYALGAANIASALVKGMPVGAGFSAGSASETAGAKTRATAVVAAIGLAALVAFAIPLIAVLPQPVLAAVVIAALTHALDPKPLLRLWRLNRDQYVAVGAALGVLALGVLNGMLLAILLSLAALLQRLASPKVARLGRLGDSHDYVDIARHDDAVAPVQVAVWRPATPLFFANAERMLALVAAGTSTEPGVTAIVLSLEESYDLDSTALEALIEFARTTRMNGLEVRLARLHDRARDLLAAAGAVDLASRGSYSVYDAVSGFEAADQNAEAMS